MSLIPPVSVLMSRGNLVSCSSVSQPSFWASNLICQIALPLNLTGGSLTTSPSQKPGRQLRIIEKGNISSKAASMSGWLHLCKAVMLAGTRGIPENSNCTFRTIFGRRERQLKHTSIFLKRDGLGGGNRKEREEAAVTSKRNICDRGRGWDTLKCWAHIPRKLGSLLS